MADDSRFDAILDDEGRLFGLVNIVDALVVLLVIAVVVAGFALVTGGGGGDPETRYATIDLNQQPSHIAGQISANDTWSVGDGDELRITDVYKYPQAGEDGTGLNVLIRAQVNGSAIEDEETVAESIQFAGEPLRYGRTLEISTSEYLVEGSVIDISEAGESLETETQSLVIQSDVDRDTATDIQPGDSYDVGGESILTVESVTVYATGDSQTRTVVMGVTAETRAEDDARFVGDVPLRTGVSLPVQTNIYSLEGSIIRVGSLDEPGVPATRTLTLQMEDVPTYRANAISVGLTESVRGVQTAEVTSVSSLSGNTLELTVEASVRERDDGSIRFRGEPLRLGQELRLELEGVTVSGQVTSISE